MIAGSVHTRDDREEHLPLRISRDGYLNNSEQIGVKEEEKPVFVRIG